MARGERRGWHGCAWKGRCEGGECGVERNTAGLVRVGVVVRIRVVRVGAAVGGGGRRWGSSDCGKVGCVKVCKCNTDV